MDRLPIAATPSESSGDAVQQTGVSGRDPTDALAILAAASEVKRAETAESLLFQYVINNDRPKERNLPTLVRVLETAVELGNADWPRRLQALTYGHDVLDFRCGATLHGAVFRALGARSYTGIDRTLELTSKRLRNRRLKQTERMPVSLSDAVRIIPGLSYIRADEVVSRGIYDIVLLESVTHSLPDLESSLFRLSQALRPSGRIWFLHENFYAWGGHQSSPRTPAEIDAADPEQRQLADWGHILIDPSEGHRFRTNFNRVRLPEFRRIVETYFELDHWLETPERASIEGRLTAERLARLPGYQRSELLVRSVVGSGRKRDSY